jgi:putative transposase
MRLNLQTYALTAICHQRRRVFQLHGFVVMPEHIHVLLTPSGAVEGAAQLIKGGFSFAVRDQFPGEVWQQGYHAHRIVDTADYWNQLAYIACNPVKRHLNAHPHVHTQCLDRLDPGFLAMAVKIMPGG